jgi:hypothetical protein
LRIALESIFADLGQLFNMFFGISLSIHHIMGSIEEIDFFLTLDE